MSAGDRGEPPPGPRQAAAGNVALHFLLSLAVAWVALSASLLYGSPGREAFLTLPATTMTAVLAIWAVFALIVWRRVAQTPRPSAIDSVLAVVFAGLAIGVWFPLTFLAVEVLPWMGVGHSAAAPHPLSALGVSTVGFGVTGYCAWEVARRLGRRPTVPLALALLVAAVAPAKRADIVRMRDYASGVARPPGYFHEQVRQRRWLPSAPITKTSARS